MHIHDAKRFLSKLTIPKMWNAIGLIFTFYWAKWTNSYSAPFLPMTLSIEPTTACNLRCPECPSGLRQFSRPTGNLKNDFFRQIISDVKGHLIYLIFYFQGEPFINPDFLKMVKHASDNGIYTITSSNGHFLSDDIAKRTVESGLDRLIISIDGTTQEVYEQYRKEGNLENVIKGAKNVVKWKKNYLKREPGNACWKMWHSAVITWDGRVVPCCFDKDASHNMGTIKTESPLEDIWQKESYQNFRTQVFQNRESIDICQNCSEGCQVWQ